MAEPVSLRYYEGVFRLLGRAPRLSADALRLIEGWEAGRGARLPAAVREWYALEGAAEVMAESYQGNRLRSLPEFLASYADAPEDQEADDLPGAVFFEPWNANTGFEAYLRPDGTDDPTVSVSPDLEEVPFSWFIADAAWMAVAMWRSHIWVVGPSVQDYPAEFGPPQLDFLAEEFEGRSRGGYEPRSFRFFRPGAWVEVYARGDPEAGTCPAAYTLWAETDERLPDLYQSLWPCHGVPARLYPYDPATRGDLVARFRARFPGAEVLA
jgi:hypothetical protein